MKEESNDKQQRFLNSQDKFKLGKEQASKIVTTVVLMKAD